MVELLIITVLLFSQTQTDYSYFIPALQVLPLYPGWHPQWGHTPVIGSHGWFIHWQVREHLFPNFPDVHATNNSRTIQVCLLFLLLFCVCFVLFFVFFLKVKNTFRSCNTPTHTHIYILIHVLNSKNCSAVTNMLYPGTCKSKVTYTTIGSQDVCIDCIYNII